MLADYGVMEVKPKNAARTDARYNTITITAQQEVEEVIRRLIEPYRSNPFSIHATGDNVRLLKMVMSQYPLDIIGKSRWHDLLVEMEREKIKDGIISNLIHITPDPRNFQGILMPFQKLGLDFLLRTNGNALIADEMGLGKTVQTLAFVAQRPRCLPAVVVAPLVTLVNWRREIHRFLRNVSVTGDREPRVELIRSGKEADLAEADFYVINYDLIHKRLRNIMAANPKTVVFDEIQNLRRSNTYKTHACIVLSNHTSIRHRIGLSGTPIYNKGEEMYDIAEVIRPGIFGTKEMFKERFYYKDEEYGTVEFRQEELSRLLQRSLIIRRKKIDVLKDLPEKNRVQQTVPINADLYEEKIKVLYDKIELARRELGAASDEVDKKRRLANFNSLLLEMRVEERQIAGLAKAPYVVEYIKNLLEDYEEEKFVVFCHHKRVHKILADGLWKHQPLQIIGGQSDHVRQNAIDRFQGDTESRIIICGLRAGNVGINLSKAAYVIFAELDWSPAVHAQAEDRLHRIGQKSNVFAHYLVGSGTFDDYIADMLMAKSDVIRKILGDKAESTSNQKALELLQKRFGLDSGMIAEDLSQMKKSKQRSIALD